MYSTATKLTAAMKKTQSMYPSSAALTAGKQTLGTWNGDAATPFSRKQYSSFHQSPSQQRQSPQELKRSMNQYSNGEDVRGMFSRSSPGNKERSSPSPQSQSQPRQSLGSQNSHSSSWAAQKRDIIQRSRGSSRETDVDNRRPESEENSVHAYSSRQTYGNAKGEGPCLVETTETEKHKDYGKESWDAEEEENLQHEYHQLALQLRQFSYSPQWCSVFGVDSWDYISNMKITSELSLTLNQCLKDKTVLQYVLHGKEFLLNWEKSTLPQPSSQDKLLAQTFDTLSNCGSDIFFELARTVNTEESRTVASLDQLLKKQGKLPGGLFDKILTSIAACNVFCCVYDESSSKHKYRCFVHLIRSNLDKHSTLSLLSLALAITAALETIMSVVGEGVISLIEDLQKSRGGNNAVTLKPEHLHRIRRLVVSRSAVLMKSAEAYTDSKSIMEYEQICEEEGHNSVSHLFEPGCMRVLRAIQLILGSLKSLCRRCHHFSSLRISMEATLQAPSLNKLLRNLMSCFWRGDDTSFQKDTITGIELCGTKKKVGSQRTNIPVEGLPKLIKSPVTETLHPFDRALLFSFGVCHGRVQNFVDEQTKQALHSQNISYVELPRQEVHYSSFGVLDGSTKIIMNHGLLCDILRRRRSDRNEEIMTQLTILTSRARPFVCAEETLKRTGIISSSLINAISAKLATVKVKDLLGSRDPTFSVLSDNISLGGSIRILNPRFLSHFDTQNCSSKGTKSEDEGEGHGPRREFFDLVATETSSEYGPWTSGQGTVVGNRGNTAVDVRFQSRVSIDDVQQFGYGENMRIRWKLRNSDEFSINEVSAFSLSPQRDCLTLSLTRPLAERVDGLPYELSSKTTTLFTHMGHGEMYWINEKLQLNKQNISKFITFGWLLANALVNRCKLPVKFPLIFYRSILEDDIEPNFIDLRTFDPGLADQCQTILSSNEEEFVSIMKLQDESMQELAHFAGNGSYAGHGKPKGIFSCCSVSSKKNSRVKPDENSSGLFHRAKFGYVRKIMYERLLGRNESGGWWMLCCIKFGFVQGLGKDVFEYLRNVLEYSGLQLFQALHSPYFPPNPMSAVSLLNFDGILYENNQGSLKIDSVFRIAYDTEARRPENKPLRDALWTIIDSMKPTDKKLFLKFVCGSDKIGGPFEDQLSIVIPTLNFTREDHLKCLKSLPTAHTCTNTLEIPNYLSSLRYLYPSQPEDRILLSLKKIIEEKVVKAITYGSGQYGLDTIDDSDGAAHLEEKANERLSRETVDEMEDNAYPDDVAKQTRQSQKNSEKDIVRLRW